MHHLSHIGNRCFVESTILKQIYPINLPNPKQFFNCQTKNVIYLIICKTPGCGAQYVGREFVFRAAEHLSNHTSPMVKHCKETKHSLKQIRFQILAQVPSLEANNEVWLKRYEYYWICTLGTLNKLSNKDLNKMPYDPIFHSYQKHWGTTCSQREWSPPTTDNKHKHWRWAFCTTGASIGFEDYVNIKQNVWRRVIVIVKEPMI